MKNYVLYVKDKQGNWLEVIELKNHSEEEAIEKYNEYPTNKYQLELLVNPDDDTVEDWVTILKN